MGKHVEKLKQNQVVDVKKQNIEAEIKKTKIFKELTEKIGNLEIAIEALNGKINELVTKPNRKENKE